MGEYFINKVSNSSSDTLLLAGFIRLLMVVLEQADKLEGNKITVQDKRSHWIIHCRADLNDEDIDSLTHFSRLQMIVTSKNRSKLSAREVEYGFQYDEQVEKRTKYAAYRKQLSPSKSSREANDPEVQEQLAQVQPDIHLPTYSSIVQVLKDVAPYNSLVRRWDKLNDEQLRICVRLLLQLFSTNPNLFDDMPKVWKEVSKEHQLGEYNTTLWQFLNPTTGKGLNSPKADALTVGNTKGFWLLEFLKCVGYFEIAISSKLQKNEQNFTDNRKTHVVRVEHLPWETLTRIVIRFRRLMQATYPAKLDVLAALYLSRAIIEERQRVLEFLEEQQELGRKVRVVEIIQGLDVTFYKSLGSAVATMNLSFVALPDWLPLPVTPDKAQAYIGHEPRPGLLTEHINIISRLEENKGEEESLVQHYRDFLSSRDPALSAFFAFTRGYATYVMRHLAKKEYVPLFSTNNLEVLMEARDDMEARNRPDAENKSLAPIFGRDGFRNVARAIRESTIRAQYRVAQEGDRRYDIAYGLGQDLARSLNQRDLFVAALTDFIRRYNAETAREEEKLAHQQGGKITPELRRQKRLRRMVSTEDVEDLIAIIDEHGHKVVGNMLLAYGYAFDSSTVRTDDTASTESEGA